MVWRVRRGGFVSSPFPEIFGRAGVGNSAAFIPRRHGGRQPAADMWHREREQQWGTPTSAGLSQSGDGAIVCSGWCSRCGGLETCRNLLFPSLAFVHYNTSLKEAQKYPMGCFSRAISARCIQLETEKRQHGKPVPIRLLDTSSAPMPTRTGGEVAAAPSEGSRSTRERWRALLPAAALSITNWTETMDKYFPELEKRILPCGWKSGPQLPVQVKLRRGVGTGWGSSSGAQPASQGGETISPGL